MNKKKNFHAYLSSFFNNYLIQERGLSDRTIQAYATAFSLFLTFLEKEKMVKPAYVNLKHISKENVESFLNWLENERQAKPSTRNLRLAAIHSFCKYMMHKDIPNINQWDNVLSIEMKKCDKQSPNYLTVGGMQLLLAQIPINTKKGLRDLALLTILYDSGARVEELIKLTPSCVRTTKPYTVKLYGKGGKARVVPIQQRAMYILKTYMTEFNLNDSKDDYSPLFFNKSGKHLSNAGITFIINQYADMARKLDNSIIPNKISPHSFRHSKAMHLLGGDVDLIYIRDILGHKSIDTTQIYARTDSAKRRKAVESVYMDIVPNTGELKLASWEKDSSLKEWLKGLGKD